MAAYILNEKKPPKNVPTVNEVVRLIASFGGFLVRKGDGEPSVKTIWQGMEQVASYAAGMKFARQLENSTRFVCKGMGLGVPANVAQAMNWFEQSAQQGIYQAQSNRGDLLTMERYGSIRDSVAGARWYQSSAEQHHAHAQASECVL